MFTVLTKCALHAGIFRIFHIKLLDFKFVETKKPPDGQASDIIPCPTGQSGVLVVKFAQHQNLSLAHVVTGQSPKASTAFAVGYAALSSLRWTQIWPRVSQICCNYHCRRSYLCPRVWSRQLWFIWKTWPTLTKYVINNLQRFVLSDAKLVETLMVDLSRHQYCIYKMQKHESHSFPSLDTQRFSDTALWRQIQVAWQPRPNSLTYKHLKCK